MNADFPDGTRARVGIEPTMAWALAMAALRQPRRAHAPHPNVPFKARLAAGTTITRSFLNSPEPKRINLVPKRTSEGGSELSLII